MEKVGFYKQFDSYCQAGNGSRQTWVELRFGFELLLCDPSLLCFVIYHLKSEFQI